MITRLRDLSLRSGDDRRLHQAAEYIHRLKEVGQNEQHGDIGRSIPKAAFTEAVEHVMTHHAPLMKKLAS